MKQTVYRHGFVDAFKNSGGYKENFSYEGLDALYDYFMEYEDNSPDTEIELDVVAICCEYTEYENFKEFAACYEDIEAIEDIADHTQFISIDGTDGFIIVDF